MTLFCPLEKLELKLTSCPTRQCIYKGLGGTCNFFLLTKDSVSIKDIATVRQIKLYKAQAMASTAKQYVTLGATLLSYVEFIKTSFPAREISGQTVNKGDNSTQINRVLFLVFGLTPQQQQYFWDEKRLSDWASRKKVSLTVPEVRSVLLAASLS